MSVPALTWFAIRLSILSFMEEGSSFELVPVVVELVRSAERLVSIASSAAVSAVASVLLRDPVERPLLIVADIWSFIDP